MTQDQVSFEISDADRALVGEIVSRTAALAKAHRQRFSRMSATMDLIATHANGNPMDFAKLLAADNFNLAHDVLGIERHLDRETGKLLNCFSPRCSARGPVPPSPPPTLNHERSSPVSATASETTSPNPGAAVVDARPSWDINPAKTVEDEFMVCNGQDGHAYGLIAVVRDGDDARLIAAAPTTLETLQAIADESVFNQQRFAEDDDADYFLRCFKAVKERARAAIARATGEAA
jgi:hypothetical protein